MASIILSFVGTQDPYSDRTKEEDGSIVSLVKHLLARQQELKHILLLHTQDLEERAHLTKEWLTEEVRIIAPIELIPVDRSLSDDPIDVFLATSAAKQAVETAKNIAATADILEFNASSGTPAMKSTWSILQAAGYAPHSRVWQIRNPKTKHEGQERVFATDLSGLKQEFDRNIIKQQLADYNYSGALATIKSSTLSTPLIEALLNYGHRRLSFDFDRANNAIANYKDDILKDFYTEIGNLKRQDTKSLLKEVYFISILSHKKQYYCDFLISISQFQENVLRFLLSEIGLSCPNNNGEI